MDFVTHVDYGGESDLVYEKEGAWAIVNVTRDTYRFLHKYSAFEYFKCIPDLERAREIMKRYFSKGPVHAGGSY